MSKIKFIIVKFERAILFQTIKNELVLGVSRTIHNGIRYTIYNRKYHITEIGDVGMLIGSNKYDQEKVSILHFTNNDKRDIYYELIIHSLKEMSEKEKTHQY